MHALIAQWREKAKWLKIIDPAEDYPSGRIDATQEHVSDLEAALAAALAPSQEPLTEDDSRYCWTCGQSTVGVEGL